MVSLLNNGNVQNEISMKSQDLEGETLDWLTTHILMHALLMLNIALPLLMEGKRDKGHSATGME